MQCANPTVGCCCCFALSHSCALKTDKFQLLAQTEILLIMMLAWISLALDTSYVGTPIDIVLSTILVCVVLASHSLCRG